MDVKENFEAMYNLHIPPIPPSLYYPYDAALNPYGPCYTMELNGARRKNATRETTSTLKQWLNEHRKNPYPTKGEKIMLAILTKMTLTQVSTWFANARRRLKKENKMTWSPRNRCDDDDDLLDDEQLNGSVNDKCSSRSASVSSVQQAAMNQHPQLNSNLNNSNLNEQQQNAAVAAFGVSAVSNLSPSQQQQLANQFSSQLTPQQQQLLLAGADPTAMAAIMQQQLAAFHHQQLHQHFDMKMLEEDTSDIVDIEEDSNQEMLEQKRMRRSPCALSDLGSLSDSDSINPLHHQLNHFHSTVNSIHQPPSSSHLNVPSHTSSNNSNISNSNVSSLVSHPTPPSSAAALLAQQQNSVLNQVHQQRLAAAASLHPQLTSSMHPAALFNAAAVAAATLSNELSPMNKCNSLLQTQNKPRIWSIVDTATNNNVVANLLDSTNSNKESSVKNDTKNLNKDKTNSPSIITVPLSTNDPSCSSVNSTATSCSSLTSSNSSTNSSLNTTPSSLAGAICSTNTTSVISNNSNSSTMSTFNNTPTSLAPSLLHNTLNQTAVTNQSMLLNYPLAPLRFMSASANTSGAFNLAKSSSASVNSGQTPVISNSTQPWYNSNNFPSSAFNPLYSLYSSQAMLAASNQYAALNASLSVANLSALGQSSTLLNSTSASSSNNINATNQNKNGTNLSNSTSTTNESSQSVSHTNLASPLANGLGSSPSMQKTTSSPPPSTNQIKTEPVDFNQN